jgi:hypothetical protein
MTNNNRITLYVILDGPPQPGRPGTRYAAPDGTMTEHKSRAATFGTAAEAKAFAKEKGIIFDDGAGKSIGRVDFTDIELQGH